MPDFVRENEKALALTMTLLLSPDTADIISALKRGAWYF